MQAFHSAASVGRTVWWDIFQGTVKQLPVSSAGVVQRHQRADRPPATYLTWHCWLPLPALLHPLLLPFFTSDKSKHCLFWKRPEVSQNISIYFLWQAAILWKVSQAQNLSGEAHLAVNSSSIWCTNTKISLYLPNNNLKKEWAYKCFKTNHFEGPEQPFVFEHRAHLLEFFCRGKNLEMKNIHSLTFC